MSAAPGCEFPNPCPHCGADDDHAGWRAQSEGSPGWTFGATHCPHPRNPGHGTGCCCAGVSRETRQRQMQEALSRPTLEQRVAALEAAMDRLLNPLVIAESPPMSEEDKAKFEAALRDMSPDFKQPLRVLPPPSLTVLDPELIRHLLRESATVVRPGEVLFFTIGDPNCTPSQIRELQDWISGWLELYAPDVKALVLPHGEMAAAESGPD